MALIIPRRKLFKLAAPALAAPAIILPHRRSEALMGIVAGTSTPTPPAWTLIASAVAQNTSPTGPNPLTTSATPIDTTNANCLLMLAIGLDGSNTLAIADSKSNSWTSPGSAPGTITFDRFTGTTIDNYCAFVNSPTVGSGHTFSVSWGSSGGTSTYAVFIVYAFKSATGTPFYDANGGAGQAQTGITSGTTLNVASITPAHANDLILTGIGDGQNISANPYSINDGFTISTQIAGNAGNGLGAAFAWLINGTTPVAPTWTFATNVSGIGSTCQTFVMGSI